MTPPRRTPEPAPEPAPGWRELTWAAFCDWLQGRRVAATEHEDYLDPELVTLTFDDGAVAELRSTKTEGSPGYSEVTPGSDGHLSMPRVRVRP